MEEGVLADGTSFSKIFLICRVHLPPTRKVNFFFMGEAIIVGRASGGSSTPRLVTEIYNTNTTWTVPKAVDQTFHIRVFGGGGSGGAGNGGPGVPGTGMFGGLLGGAGGRMNNATFALLPGEQISISIGGGGKTALACTGGTTAFGEYLSAVGGAGVSSGGATAGDRINGGSGGGGGFIINENISNTSRIRRYQFGGNGAQFGGGGGFYIGGRGGEYGGNGGSVYGSDTTATGGHNGINTIGNNNYPDGSSSKFGFDLNLQGAGLCMNPGNNYYGDGGCGGNGGYNLGGGGGGYGGNGGNGAYIETNNNWCFAGGGGGGYGADGGDAYAHKINNYHAVGIGGGGGGYGKGGHGGNGVNNSKTANANGGIAAGGGGSYSGNPGYGGNGICIIQYYI